MNRHISTISWASLERPTFNVLTSTSLSSPSFRLHLSAGNPDVASPYLALEPLTAIQPTVTTPSTMSSAFPSDIHPGSSLHQRVSSPLPRGDVLDSPLPTERPKFFRPNNPPFTPHSPSLPFPPPIPPRPTPLPYLKILPLLITRCSEGLTWSIVLPYINDMISHFGVPDESVGVWSATAVRQPPRYRCSHSSRLGIGAHVGGIHHRAHVRSFV